MVGVGYEKLWKLAAGVGMQCPNLGQARHYFELAAAQGIASAQLSLGNLYEEGLGVEQDYGLTRRYYESKQSSSSFVCAT
jgi:TPR repeat protein